MLSHKIVTAWWALFALCGLAALGAHAAVDLQRFDDPERQARYERFIEELRCPKCQNNNLADSNAPIAKDLRREVYRLIEEGNDDPEIVDFMVSRYGDYVLYRPPVQPNTWVLWFGPGVLAMFGLALVIWVARRMRRVPAGGEAHLSAEEQARLDRLLAQQANETHSDNAHSDKESPKQ